MIKRLYDKIGEEKVLESLRNQGKELKKSKKRLLLLAKIYSKNNSPEYNKVLSDCIKGSSENFQNIQ